MEQTAMPLANPSIELREIGDQVLVHDRRSEKVHVINVTAAEVLRACDGVTPMQTLVERLASRGNVDPARVAGDVREICERFRALQILD